jgi:hypothetical protein
MWPRVQFRGLMFWKMGKLDKCEHVNFALKINVMVRVQLNMIILGMNEFPCTCI